MADLSITPANVVPGSDAVIVKGATAGATITAGDSIYIDAADRGKIKPCDADAAASAVCAGIALNGASDNQPVSYQSGGSLTIGATVVIGVSYYVTPNAGGLGVWAEVLSADYATLVCIGKSVSVVMLALTVTGAVKA